MYDLETLNRMNWLADQAHQRKMEMANGEANQNSVEQVSRPVFPLAVLARKLITGPPSLAALLDLLDNTELTVLFRELVQQFLPEYEVDIMNTDIDARINRFVHYFNERYFPLSDRFDFDEFSLEDFLGSIPVDLMGFTDDDYHQFSDFRQGYTLMLALVENPFGAYSQEDLRVPILLAAKELVGAALLNMIPEDGYSTQELHKKLDETKYRTITVFADWVHSETNCMLLNASYDEYAPEPWSRAIVDQLTDEWPMVQELQNDMANASAWLEENPSKNFRELLYFLSDDEAIKEMEIPREQIPLPLDEIERR